LAIQHKDIPDAQRHEPKGVSTAANRQAYFADGAGSGTWKKVGSENLDGLTGDGGSSTNVIMTNGLGGFMLKRFHAYGSMTITNNANNFAVTAAVDQTLQTNSDYKLFTAGGAPWIGDQLYGVSFSVDRLIAPITGVYDLRFWANISTYPSNVSVVGAKFKINNSTWAPKMVVTKSNSAGDYGHLSSFTLLSLNANDYVQLFVASTATGNLVISNANVTMDLVRAT
jgi:hypothetical protein